ncbi:hypothetical protein [Roseomonas sp. BN140053]|uniref:hypothetical protein n=1 Tax=Roseomonas sp. BN140053 TaxID=3391898 RepID=UPI0039EAB6F8
MPELPSSIAEVLDHRGAQERVWRASRIAWVGMAVALALAAAGLFGDGPLSHRDIRAGDGSLRLEYERFQRTGGTTVLVLHAAARDAKGEQRICLGRDLLDEWQLVRLEPDSARQVITPEGMCLDLLAEAGAQPPPIRAWVQPRAMTFGARGTLRAGDGAPLVMRAWVWP